MWWALQYPKYGFIWTFSLVLRRTDVPWKCLLVVDERKFEVHPKTGPEKGKNKSQSSAWEFLDYFVVFIFVIQCEAWPWKLRVLNHPREMFQAVVLQSTFNILFQKMVEVHPALTLFWSFLEKASFLLLNRFAFPSWLGSLATSSVKSNICVLERESAEGGVLQSSSVGYGVPCHCLAWCSQWVEEKRGPGGQR